MAKTQPWIHPNRMRWVLMSRLGTRAKLAWQTPQTHDLHMDALRTALSEASELVKTGKREQAQPLLNALLKAHPEDPEATFHLGVCLLRQSDFDGALKRFREAVALQSDHYNAHYYLGLVLEHRGEDARALVEYRVA